MKDGVLMIIHIYAKVSNLKAVCYQFERLSADFIHKSLDKP